jgi:IS30 family transposase
MKTPKLCPAERLEVCHRRLQGEATESLARAYAVAANTIRRILHASLGPRPGGRQPCLSPEQQQEVRLRALGGEIGRSLAVSYGVSIDTIYRITSTLRRMHRRVRSHKRCELRLSVREREEISRGVLGGDSARAIARTLRRSPSTVSREIGRAGGRGSYRAWRAEEQFLRKSSRPKTPKLARSSALRAQVEKGLANFWSPEQISAYLRREFPDDPTMHVSHETIYRSLYVQGRGALRAELKKYLRSGRRRRRPKGNRPRVGGIREMVPISQRPPEAEDRAVPGHWEGDLLIGRRGQSAIATLVERKSRYVMLAALPNGRTADVVRDALVAKIKKLPAELRRTLTWDQGVEMAQHASFTVATGVKVYFCDPHSPWQRGSNENTNGLLRQFLPKTADFTRKSQAELNRIAMLLNRRPRQTLNWMSPCEVLNRAVAMTG